MKEITRRALSTTEHVKKTDLASDPERFFLLLNDRRKKLETLLQTTTDYKRWLVRVDTTIRRNWYRILQQEKGWAVIGYLRACFEILKEVQDTMSTPTRGPPLPLIKYYRVRLPIFLKARKEPIFPVRSDPTFLTANLARVLRVVWSRTIPRVRTQGRCRRQEMVYVRRAKPPFN